MQRLTAIALVSLLTAPTAATAQPLDATDPPLVLDAPAAHPPSVAPAPPAPAPSRPRERSERTGGWLGVRFPYLGAGVHWSSRLVAVDVVPTIEYSVTFTEHLRVSSRFAWSGRFFDDDGDDAGFAQAVRGDLGVTLESDVGPYLGARVGVSYGWDLPATLDGRTDRWGLLLALEAGLAWNLDREAHLGLGATWLLEPDTSSTVLLGVHFAHRVFDV